MRPRKRFVFSLAAVAAVGMAAAWFVLFHVDVYRPQELARAVGARHDDEQTIVMVGDVMTWDETATSIERSGPDYPFVATMPLLRSADLTIANLEGPIADRAPKVWGGWSYRVPSFTLAGLQHAGIDVVGLANNHAMDCGAAGLVETFEHLREFGLDFFGAGANRTEAAAPKVIQLGGLRLALVGLVTADSALYDEKAAQTGGAYANAMALCLDRFQATDDRAGTIVATPDVARELIAASRRVADFVIAFVHWGVRYQRHPSALEQELGRVLVESGADLIVGHHAHFWQPVGTYRGVPIVYGTGNFAFGSNNWQADEALLVRAVIKNRALDRVEFFPLAIRNANPLVHYQPKVLKGRSARNLLERLRQESRALGTELRLDEDRAVLNLSLMRK